MYNSFFSLSHSPFDLCPDPAFFVSTAAHDEALATLYYGVRQHKGLTVITGEVGTGKTLLLRCLLKLLKDSPDIEYSYMFNSRLDALDFLRYIVADFGLPVRGESKADHLIALTDFLTTRGKKSMTTVLIIDEAHDLSEEVLEEIRLLSNIETADDKLLQILLIGQPELEEKLDATGLRQLKQRIALRARLRLLTCAETEHYISQRLLIAGTDSPHRQLFREDALEAIYHYSRGTPRLINTLCDNCLICAFAKQLQQIDAQIVDEVAAEFRLEAPLIRELESWSADNVG